MADLAAIFSSFGDYSVYLILLFIIVVIVAIKITKLIFGLGIAAVIGALFPFIINDILKVSGLVEPGIQSSITFAVLAVIVYGVYSLLTMVYGLLKTTGKAAFLPVRIFAFIGEVTIKFLKFLGVIVIAPIKYIGKLMSESNKGKDGKKDRKDDMNKTESKGYNPRVSDDDFWKGREGLAEDEYDGSEDMSIGKSEEQIEELPVAKDDSKKDKNSFLSKVYADYEEFEKDKKKKKD